MTTGQRRVLVRASVSDGYDGLVRLMSDAQRLGFRLRDLNCVCEADASAAISLTIGVDGDVECAVIGARMARHPTIHWVETIELGEEPQPPPVRRHNDQPRPSPRRPKSASQKRHESRT